MKTITFVLLLVLLLIIGTASLSAQSDSLKESKTDSDSSLNTLSGIQFDIQVLDSLDIQAKILYYTETAVLNALEKIPPTPMISPDSYAKVIDLIKGSITKKKTITNDGYILSVKTDSMQIDLLYSLPENNRKNHWWQLKKKEEIKTPSTVITITAKGNNFYLYDAGIDGINFVEDSLYVNGWSYTGGDRDSINMYKMFGGKVMGGGGGLDYLIRGVAWEKRLYLYNRQAINMIEKSIYSGQ